MINIALVLTPIEFGGAEKVSYILLESFKNTDIKITPILLIRPWEKNNVFIRKIVEEGYSYHEVPVTIKKDGEGIDCFRIFRCIYRIFKIIKSGNYDLVHTNGYFADITGIIAAKLLRKKIISTTHGFIWNNWKYRIYNCGDLFVLRFFDKIIAVSEELINILVGNKINPDKIEVVTNAIPCNERKTKEETEDLRRELRIGSNDFVIGYIGRLSAEKNVLNIIKASYELINEGQNVKTLIIGKGPEEEKLKRYIENKGIQKHIRLIGFVENVEKYIPAFNVFVISSSTEGTPMALLEAMAYGVPVVATQVGGIPNIINHNNSGILIKPEDHNEIKEAIKNIIPNDRLRNTMILESRNTIKERFGIEKWKNKYRTLYKETVEHAR